MNQILIQPTDDTPKVTSEISGITLSISGRSLPEDAISFYSPVIEWLKNYIQSPQTESNFNFHFEYISTSSTKQIMKLFLMINELAGSKSVKVCWKYDKDDEDMKQTGKRLQKLTSIDFEYKEV